MGDGVDGVRVRHHVVGERRRGRATILPHHVEELIVPGRVLNLVIRKRVVPVRALVRRVCVVVLPFPT